MTDGGDGCGWGLLRLLGLLTLMVAFTICGCAVSGHGPGERRGGRGIG